MHLLLDSHISPRVAELLAKFSIDAVALAHWQEGKLRAASDELVLHAALQAGRVLVTFDLRSIPPLLRDWAQSGRSHGGVILVDQRTLRPSDFGGLSRALVALCGDNQADWTDRVVFLGPPTQS